MPYQPFNYAAIAPQGNPHIRDFVQNLAKGYQAGQMPAQMERQRQQEELRNSFLKLKMQEEPERFNASQLGSSLANSLKQKELDYADPFAKARLDLLGAQMEKAKRAPNPLMSNYEKAVQGAERMKQMYGENSSYYKDAVTNAQRIAQGSQGMQLTVDPATGMISFNQGGSRGAPTGQIVNGQYVQKPTTPVTTAQQNSSVSNVKRKTLADAIKQPYIGQGSNKQLLSDRYNYEFEKDPIKKKEIGERLIDAAVAMKLVPEYAGTQLNSQGINATVPALHHQTNAIKQGWAEALDVVVNNLPAELQEEAKKRHDDILDQTSNKTAQHVAKGFPMKIEKESDNKKSSKSEKTLNLSTGEWE